MGHAVVRSAPLTTTEAPAPSVPEATRPEVDPASAEAAVDLNFDDTPIRHAVERARGAVRRSKKVVQLYPFPVGFVAATGVALLVLGWLDRRDPRLAPRPTDDEMLGFG